MASTRFHKVDILDFAKLGAVFVGVGVAYGALSGDGAIIGALLGVALFAFMMGIGLLAGFVARGHE